MEKSEKLQQLLRDRVVLRELEDRPDPMHFFYSLLWDKQINPMTERFFPSDLICTNARIWLDSKERLSLSAERFLLTRELEPVCPFNLPETIACLLQDWELLRDDDKNKTVFFNRDRWFKMLASMSSLGNPLVKNFEQDLYLRQRKPLWQDYFECYCQEFKVYPYGERSEVFACVHLTEMVPIEKAKDRDVARLAQVATDFNAFIKFYWSYYGNGIKEHTREILKELEPYPEIHGFACKNTKFYLKDLLSTKWKSKLPKLANFLAQHRGLKRRFLEHPLKRQLEILSIYHQVEEEYGRWAIGAIETHSKELVEKDEIEAFLKKKQVENTQILVEPISIPPLKGGWHCVELISRKALIDEGEYNRHCVGGYGDIIRYGRARVFSFRKGKIRHTVQYEITREGKWTLAQSRGYRNCFKSTYDPVEHSFLDYNEIAVLDVLNKSWSSWDTEAEEEIPF